jgi:oligosaccharide repeat unit polymerase
MLAVLPIMIMLPFAKSELNAFAAGDAVEGIIADLPSVFPIALLGYFAMLTGGSLWHIRSGLGLRRSAIVVLDIVPRCSMMLMSSGTLLIFQTLLCSFLQVLILAIYFTQSGFGFDLRAYTFANPSFRPVVLVVSNYSIIIASHCLARYVDTKERTLLACTLLLTFGLVFFGARGNILTIYLYILICYLIKLRNKISLIRVISLAAVMILAGLYLGIARSGEYSLAQLFGSLAILLFYGNTFSDLRDFTWVYSKWDHVFWGGKTYLAALMAFIPRVASQFRDTWGLGVATSSTVGLDPQIHPGLRPSVFGEGYFNFGLLGVIAIGLMLGIISQRVDLDVKRAMAARQPSMRRAFASTMMLGVAGSLAITAGFSSLFVLGGVYGLSWFFLGLLKLLNVPASSINTAE